MEKTIQNQRGSSLGFLRSPIVSRLAKITERDGTCATYAGIRRKCLFFMLMVLAGAALSFILPLIPSAGVTDENGIFVSFVEVYALIASLAFMVICPFLAAFIRKTAPVTGSLSCIGNGFILAFIGRFVPEYRGPMLLAFVLTFALVLVMQYLYFSGKIQVNKKFRVVLTTFFGTAILGGIFVGACYFIPGCKDIYSYIQNNTLISLLISAGGIIIATLFLLVDFDTIRYAVENKLPKKYEWVSAYALAFTVIWLYFKILDLIVKSNNAANKGTM